MKNQGKDKKYLDGIQSKAPIQKQRMVLLPHDPAWALEFEKEKQVLVSILGSLVLDIEHTGSTAVPGLLAKPIIDILIGVRNVHEIRALNETMSGQGYTETNLVQTEHHAIYSKGIPPKFHIHFVECDLLKGTSHPLFRDILRTNLQMAQEYSNLKMRLAKKYPMDSKAYSFEKGQWIQRVMRDGKNKIEV